MNTIAQRHREKQVLEGLIIAIQYSPAVDTSRQRLSTPQYASTRQP